MKQIFFLLLLLGMSYSGFSQYGRLEPLQEGDTTNFVLRTPKEVLKKFEESPDKATRKLGAQLESIEKHLDNCRAAYISRRILTSDIRSFIATVKSLESKGVDVSNYIREAVLYTKQPEGLAY